MYWYIIQAVVTRRVHKAIGSLGEGLYGSDAINKSIVMLLQLDAAVTLWRHAHLCVHWVDKLNVMTLHLAKSDWSRRGSVPMLGQIFNR